MGTPTFYRFLGQPVSAFRHPAIAAASFGRANRLSIKEMAAVTDAYVGAAPTVAKQLMLLGRGYYAALEKGDAARARLAQQGIERLIQNTPAREWKRIFDRALRQLHPRIIRFADSTPLRASADRQPPLFKKDVFIAFQFAELLYMLNEKRKPGERVVRVQVLSSQNGFRVSTIGAIEARSLPLNQSVTLWGYYGRGENADRIIALKVRYSVVADERPAHRFRTTIRESGVLTPSGWIRHFSGANTSWWDYGPQNGEHGFKRSTYQLPKDRRVAQEIAAGILRPPLEFAWRALKGRGWRVVGRIHAIKD